MIMRAGLVCLDSTRTSQVGPFCPAQFMQTVIIGPFHTSLGLWVYRLIHFFFFNVYDKTFNV